MTNGITNGCIWVRLENKYYKLFKDGNFTQNGKTLADIVDVDEGKDMENALHCVTCYKKIIAIQRLKKIYWLESKD